MRIGLLLLHLLTAIACFDQEFKDQLEESVITYGSAIRL